MRPGRGEVRKLGEVLVWRDGMGGRNGFREGWVGGWEEAKVGMGK